MQKDTRTAEERQRRPQQPDTSAVAETRDSPHDEEHRQWWLSLPLEERERIIQEKEDRFREEIEAHFSRQDEEAGRPRSHGNKWRRYREAAVQLRDLNLPDEGIGEAAVRATLRGVLLRHDAEGTNVCTEQPDKLAERLSLSAYQVDRILRACHKGGLVEYSGPPHSRSTRVILEPAEEEIRFLTAGLWKEDLPERAKELWEQKWVPAELDKSVARLPWISEVLDDPRLRLDALVDANGKRLPGARSVKAVAFAIDILSRGNGFPARWTVTRELAGLSGLSDPATNAGLKLVEQHGWIDQEVQRGRSGAGRLIRLTYPKDRAETIRDNPRWSRYHDER